MQDLAHDDVEERQPVLDLEQGLRPGHPHARPEPAVELDDHRALERGARAVLVGGQLVGIRQLVDRLDLGLGELACLALPQAPEVVLERRDADVGDVAVAHLLQAGVELVVGHGADPTRAARAAASEAASARGFVEARPSDPTRPG